MSDVPLDSWEGASPVSWARRWQVPLFEAYGTVDSTNRRARELVERGSQPYSLVVADAQRAGRGRGGKTWHSPAGCGLWLSVLLPGSSPDADLPVPLVIGLAAAEAIETHLPALSIGIEWPNDLTIEDRKVGGILCEVARHLIVAGIGINLRTPGGGYPESIAHRATSLEVEGGKLLSRSDLTGSIVARARVLLSQGATGGRARGEALASIRARDTLAGRLVHTEQHGTGVAGGISEQGELRLERPDGTRVSVSAGPVRPARAG